jgi:hypothetical protein
MEYNGKLYGKIGNKYFDTGKTSNDFDEMFEMLQKLIVTFSGQELELYQGKRIEEAEQLLKKITEQ